MAEQFQSQLLKKQLAFVVKGDMNKIFALVFQIFLVSQIFAFNDVQGIYTVPVTDSELKPFATFNVKNAKFNYDGKQMQLRIVLPYELSFQKDLEFKFEGTVSESRFAILRSTSPKGLTDELSCSLAKSQNLWVCVANFSSLKGERKVEQLREYLSSQTDTFEEKTFHSIFKVAEVFGSDAIGILSYKVPVQDY